MKTYMAKAEAVERKWYVVDAAGVPLGRLASRVASVLRGKNKPTYTPNVDTGDFVIVINTDKAVLTGKKLENKLSAYLGTEDTILYSSCFDANSGLFETLLTEEDAVISDELNHASIIDGIRLCKAKRFRYKNNDMKDLEEKLIEAGSCRIKLIATDGVFSMDGIIANLQGVCDLAEKYGALVVVDDSHATGFMGKTGRGTPEHCGVQGRVDILTGTFGKALGHRVIAAMY